MMLAAETDEVLNTLSQDVITGVREARRIAVDVNPLHYLDYFSSLYHDISFTCPYLAREVDCETFVVSCAYMLSIRIEYVYQVSGIGRREVHTLIRTYQSLPSMPRALLRVISRFGVCRILNGQVTVIPRYVGDKSFETFHPDRMKTRLDRFRHWTHHYQMGRLTEGHTGTPFWLLRAGDPDTGALAKESDSVVIKAAFSEYSPQDALLAAVVQNGFSGDISPELKATYCKTSVINDIMYKRFALNNDRLRD